MVFGGFKSRLLSAACHSSKEVTTASSVPGLECYSSSRLVGQGGGVGSQGGGPEGCNVPRGSSDSLRVSCDPKKSHEYIFHPTIQSKLWF